MKTKKIGFIGGGNMASSLIKGLIANEHPPQQIWVADINQQVLDTLHSTLSVHISKENHQVIQEVDVVVFAVKPQVLENMVTEKSTHTALQDKNPLIISIVAGINQSSLTRWLGCEMAIVRCMPNMPALVSMGATALYANEKVNSSQKELAENILRAVGIALWVDHEAQLDAVTAVSGSGPAYYFLLMEAMEKAALELGLEQQSARLLIQQTALGTAKMALESEESPEQLRHRVSSPGGTTEKAIETFEQGHFTPLVVKALKAAKERSVELSEKWGDSQ